MAEEKPRGTGKGQQPSAGMETRPNTPPEPEPKPEVQEDTQRERVVTASDRKKNGTPKEPPPTAPAGEQAGRGRATDTPVFLPPPPRTSEYVVTVDNRTNTPIKIERLNEKTGERKELTDAEYRAIFPAGRPAMSAGQRSRMGTPFSGGSAESSPQDAATVEAYYRGVADYIRAITGLW